MLKHENPESLPKQNQSPKPIVKLHPVLLNFTNETAETEQAFLEEYFQKSITPARLSLVFAVILYGAFGFLDWILAPSQAQTLWTIRFGIIIPLLLLFLCLTFTKLFKKWSQYLLASAAFIAGVGLVVILLQAPEPASNLYFAGLLFVFMMSYVFMRLRFIWASVVNWTVVIIYEITALHLSNLELPIFISINFFFISANLIGMFASYIIESYMRREFILSKRLTEEKEKVFQANQELENKVWKRTFELQRSQEALTESDLRYRLLVESAAEGICSFNTKGKIEIINAAAGRILDIDPLTSINKYLTDILPANIGTELENMIIDQATIAGKSSAKEFELRTDFIQHSFITTVKPIRDDNGKVSSILCLLTDITEHKRIEEELRQKEEMLSSIIESMSDGIIVLDKDFQFTYCNSPMEQIFNKTRQEIITSKQPAWETLPHLLDYGADSMMQMAMQGEIIRQDDIIHVIDGEEKGYTSEIYIPLKNVDGEIRGILGVIRDVSERRQAETALRKAHTEVKGLLEAITSILISVGHDNCIQYWNETAEHIFGIPATELIEKPFFNQNIPWTEDKVKTGVEKLRQENRQIRVDEIMYKRTDGTYGELGISLTPIEGANGEKGGFLLLGADVTERRVMQQQLLQAQKLKSIGQLAAGIAHEINTPVQYIGSNIRFIRKKLNIVFDALISIKETLNTHKDADAADAAIKNSLNVFNELDLDYLSNEIPLAIEQSAEGVENIANIVKSMREFSHPGTAEKVMVDINNAIDSTIVVARNEWKYVAEIETSYDENLPMVLCLPVEINQAILNILINASHAIADAQEYKGLDLGKITVNTRQDQDWVEIRISDTGMGIPTDVQAHIFEPFFTTKEVGRGTGQGLSIVHNVIVERHGGSLRFDTEPNQGTTFIIRLPIQ